MNNAIESEWFEYESWDSYDLDYGDIVFHNCKLKKDIGLDNLINEICRS